jgi:hypothetical protein
MDLGASLREGCCAAQPPALRTGQSPPCVVLQQCAPLHPLCACAGRWQLHVAAGCGRTGRSAQTQRRRPSRTVAPASRRRLVSSCISTCMAFGRAQSLTRVSGAAAEPPRPAGVVSPGAGPCTQSLCGSDARAPGVGPRGLFGFLRQQSTRGRSLLRLPLAAAFRPAGTCPVLHACTRASPRLATHSSAWTTQLIGLYTYPAAQQRWSSVRALSASVNRAAAMSAHTTGSGAAATAGPGLAEEQSSPQGPLPVPDTVVLNPTEKVRWAQRRGPTAQPSLK